MTDKEKEELKEHMEALKQGFFVPAEEESIDIEAIFEYVNMFDNFIEPAI